MILVSGLFSTDSKTLNMKTSSVEAAGRAHKYRYLCIAVKICDLFFNFSQTLSVVLLENELVSLLIPYKTLAKLALLTAFPSVSFFLAFCRHLATLLGLLPPPVAR